jgi:hypothetical protein
VRAKKSSVNFMSGLRALEADTVQRRLQPAPAAVQQPGAGEGGEAAGASVRPRSRRGKVSMTQWVDPAIRKQLAQLALDHDKSQAELVVEALNLLFERYGKSPIATA